MAVEDANLHDRPGNARRQAKRRITHVRRLLAKDGAKQLLLGGHRAFALRRDLADENISRLNLSSDIDDAGLIKVLQRLFRHVRNIARDFFRPKFRIAGRDFELLDVDRGEDVGRDDTLG